MVEKMDTKIKLSTYTKQPRQNPEFCRGIFIVVPYVLLLVCGDCYEQGAIFDSEKRLEGVTLAPYVLKVFLEIVYSTVDGCHAERRLDDIGAHC